MLQAIVAHTEEQHLRAPIHQACEVVLGMGMRAELDGTRLLVGSPALLRRHGVELTEDAQGWTEQLRSGGETVICIAHDEDLIGLLGVSDAVRSGADTVIRQLTDLGVSRVVLLTGDAPETAQAVADTLGITEVHAPALPEGKLQLIRDLQAEGHTVAMVGDGTNDAPALALADVGISMGAHSSHVAVETVLTCPTGVRRRVVRAAVLVDLLEAAADESLSGALSQKPAFGGPEVEEGLAFVGLGPGQDEGDGQALKGAHQV